MDSSSQAPERATSGAYHTLLGQTFRSGELVAGAYKLLRPLGEGGTSQVFAAQDVRLGRRVALKTMDVPLGLTEEERDNFIKLFRRDAASTAQLNHPNIVTIHGIEVHEGTPFMVLEYVRGTTLDALRGEDKRIPEAQLLRYALQIADAMSYAHSRGIVHRDLKPQNVMVDEDGRIKVLDFGIALMLGHRHSFVDAFERSAASLAEHIGSVIPVAGTPLYMAPEQFLGKEQDTRVDVWAFGVMLYELLLGKRPYKTPWQVLPGFTVTFPQGGLVDSGAVRELIEKCIVYDPGERLGGFQPIQAFLRQGITQVEEDVLLGYAPAATTNIRPRQNTFVGRSDELERIHELVDEAKARLMTLVGPGGVGKTRVATQWALEHMQRGGASSVLMCDLTEARDRADIIIALARSMEVPLSAGDHVRQLTATLARRERLILIFDNCEQILDPLAALLPTVLAEAGVLRIVATSREPLGIGAERVVNLEPLSVEPGDYEARDLFEVRASEFSQGWTCPPGEEQALAQLVRQLDGLPLAIELAAARARMLSPKKMLERMSQPFKLLRSSKGELSPRQATLLATLEWSWDLLDDIERATLMQLAAFEGGFTLEDAEEVVDLLDVAGDDGFVLDALYRLVDRSMVRYEPETQRYRLLVSVQAFASSKLAEAGRVASTRDRHARCYAKLGAEGILALNDTGRVGPLLAEADNIDAALEHAFRGEDQAAGELVLSLATAYAVIVEWRGPFDAIYALLERVRPYADEHQERGAIFRLRTSEVLLLLGDFELAEALQLEALEVAETIGHRRLQSVALGRLGTSTFNTNQYDEALGYYARAIEVSRSVGSDEYLSAWLGGLGAVHWNLGKSELALEHHTEALEIARRTGSVRREAIEMGRIGVVLGALGELERAGRSFERAVLRSRALSDRRGEAVWLGNLGVVAKLRGDLLRARALYGRALSLFEDLGDLRQVAMHLGYLAGVASARKEHRDAHDLYARAVAAAQDVSDQYVEALYLGRMGYAALEAENLELAASSFAQALEKHRELENHHLYVLWECGLGRVATARGDLDEAQSWLERARATIATHELEAHTEPANRLEQLEGELAVERARA